MKKSKFVKAIAAFTMSAVAAAGCISLVACGGHSHHTSKTGWQGSDENQHWHVCDEDDTEYGHQGHVWGDDTVCDECGYDSSTGPVGPGITTHTVTFITGEGGSAVDSATTDTDGKVSKPATDPTNTDETKLFDGWYEDEACTKLFDFNKVIPGDMNIYAGWRTADALDQFVAQGGVLYQNRFTDSGTVECIGTDETAPASGVYGTVSDGAAEFSDKNKVVIEGGKLKVLDTSTLTTYAYINVEPVSMKKVHVYAQVQPQTEAGSWNLLSILDGDGNAIALVRTNGSKKVGVSVDGGSTIVGAEAECKGTITVEATIDLGAGTISVKLNGKAVEFAAADGETPAVTTAEINAMTFGGVGLMTAGSASRDIYLDKIGIRAENSEVTPEAVKTKLVAALEAKYTALDVENKYTENGEELNAQYAIDKAALEAAETQEEMLTAYNTAIANLGSWESDAAISLKNAKETACTTLEGYKSAGDYTINAEDLAAAVNAGKTAINAAKTEEAVTAALDAAKAAIDGIKSDAQELDDAKTAAIEELNSYKDATDYTYASNKTAYENAIKDGEDAINGVTIGEEGVQAALTAVETELGNAKTALDAVPTNAEVGAGASLDETKDASKLELQKYAESVKKANAGDEIIAGVVDAKLQEGIEAIEAVTEEQGKDAVDTACDDAKDAIDAAVAAKKAETYAITVSGVEGVTVPDVTYGGTITAPAAPKQDGKLFAGWYTAETDGTEFDFATKIYAATTIYARFTDIPTYATLSAQNNVVLKEDFSSYTAGQKLYCSTSYDAAGVYAAVEDAAIIVDNKGDLAVKHNASTNTNINVAFGAVSGVVEGSFNWFSDAMGSKWQVWQLVGASGSLCYLYTADGDGTLEFYVGGSKVSNLDNTIKLAKNETHTVYFKVDLNKGTITITVDGKLLIGNYSANITAVKGMTVISSSGGTRKVVLDNIVITGTADLETTKTTLKAALQTAAEGLTVDGLAAVDTAITNATTVLGAYEAYRGGLPLIKEAAAAKALADAKAAVLAEIETAYPAANYTKSETSYNNALDLVKNATTVEDVELAKGTALSAISGLLTDDDLDNAVALSLVLVGGTVKGAEGEEDKTVATLSKSSIDVSSTTSEEYVKTLVTVEKGYEIDGYYSDANCKTEFDFTAEVAEGATLYIKVIKTVKPAGFTQSEINDDLIKAINAQRDASNNKTLDEDGIIKLVYNADLSSGSHSKGGAYINIGQIGKTTRYIKIDLSGYTGKATVTLTGFSSTAGRTMFITTTAPASSVESATDQKIVTKSDGPVSGDFELDCGSVYYVKTDNTVYLCGITVALDNAVKK